MNFSTTLLLEGKTSTGLLVPESVVESLGRGKKPPVRVTIKGHTYPSTIASRGDRYLISVSADIRKITGLTAGDTVDVEIELDDTPRTVTVPDDLAAELDAEPAVRAFFDSLSYSNQLAHALSVEQAKTPETRQRRISKAMATLREGKPR